MRLFPVVEESDDDTVEADHAGGNNDGWNVGDEMATSDEDILSIIDLDNCDDAQANVNAAIEQVCFFTIVNVLNLCVEII